MPYLNVTYTIRGTETRPDPVPSELDVYAGSAPTTGQMSDFVQANRVPPNQRRYARAMSLLGGPIDTPPHKRLLIKAWPHCRMRYGITAHRAWARVDASVGLRVAEIDENDVEVARPVDWWLTLWNRTETNSSGTSFKQENPVLLRDSLPIREGMRYEIMVKARVGAGATGKTDGRQSWTFSSLFIHLSSIWYDFE